MPLLLCGCLVPYTTIKGSIAGQPFEVRSPKDSEITNLVITATSNGAVSVHIGGMKVRMNPDVISMSGEAYAKVTTAIASGVASGLVQGAAKAGGVP